MIAFLHQKPSTGPVRVLPEWRGPLSPRELPGPATWSDFKRYRELYFEFLNVLQKSISEAKKKFERSQNPRIFPIPGSVEWQTQAFRKAGEQLNRDVEWVTEALRRKFWRHVLIRTPEGGITESGVTVGKWQQINPESLTASFVSPFLSYYRKDEQVNRKIIALNRFGRSVRQKARRMSDVAKDKLSWENASRFMGAIMKKYGMDAEKVLDLWNIETFQNIPCTRGWKSEKDWETLWKRWGKPGKSFNEFQWAMAYPWNLSEFAGLSPAHQSDLKGQSLRFYILTPNRILGLPISIMDYVAGMSGIPNCIVERKLLSTLQTVTGLITGIAFSFIPGGATLASTALSMAQKFQKMKMTEAAQKKAASFVKGASAFQKFQANLQYKKDLEKAASVGSVINQVVQKELSKMLKSGKTLPFDSVVHKLTLLVRQQVGPLVPQQQMQNMIASSLKQTLPRDVYKRMTVSREELVTPHGSLRKPVGEDEDITPLLLGGGLLVGAAVLALAVS